VKLEEEIKGRNKRNRYYQLCDYRRKQKEEDLGLWCTCGSVYKIIVQRCVITLDQMLQWEGKVV
jgi:hypothetical protein